LEALEERVEAAGEFVVVTAILLLLLAVAVAEAMAAVPAQAVALKLQIAKIPMTSLVSPELVLKTGSRATL
jgi:hypothetical protein